MAAEGTRISRRTVLVSAAASGAALVLGFSLRRARDDATGASPVPTAPGNAFQPNLWIRIPPEGPIVITVHKCEMGQGVLTSLAMLIAEELEIDVRQAIVEQADADFRFTDQNTSGSSSIIDSWEPLRRAGAIARVLLVRAAAQAWGVAEAECVARLGTVKHEASGRTLAYGALAVAAAKLSVPGAGSVPEPGSVDLKPPWHFRVIGRPVERHDAGAKATGTQMYGIDVRVPGMLHAAVLRCPVLSGRVCATDPQIAATLPGIRLERVDLDAARALPGVRHVLTLDEDVPARLPPRIAVVANSTWAAFQALQRLQAQWDEGPMAQLSSDGIARRLRESGDPVLVVRDSGEALARGVREHPTLAAEYSVPFLAHAPMEPINCTAQVRPGGAEIWAPTQFPQRAVDHAARISGLKREQIRLHVMPMGGAFGRRASPDFVVEAVQISQAVRAPVKVTWTREQDIAQDFFRPVSLQNLSAVLDARGRIDAWLHCMAGPSIIHQFLTSMPVPIEGNEIDGAVSLPYRIPHVRVEWRHVEVPVPLGVWRSVAQSQNVFAVESFLDEIAAMARRDPLDLRREMLAGDARLRNVLDIAVREAGGNEPGTRERGARSRRGEGRARARGFGIALNRYGPNTAIALVARVAVAHDGTFRVEKLTCAVDCGQVVNPLSLRAQIEGGLVWGLSSALRGRITLERGRVQQTNFHDYPVVRMNEMPELDIHVVEADSAPGGIGEPCAPPVAPAVANAIFDATGVRIRTLPLPERLTLHGR